MQGQLDSILLANSKLIDIEKYNDHKNSPYYFNEWVVGSIFGTNGEVIDSVLLNYNGYTRAFEVKVGDRYIKLDNQYFVRVAVDNKRNKLTKEMGRRVVFQKAIHPKFTNEFLTLNYTGRSVFLLSQFITGIQKSERLDLAAGALLEKRKFTPKKIYYLLRDGDLKQVKIKKKSVLKALGYKKQLSTFLKDNNNEMKNERDFHQLLAYFDTIVEDD